MAATLGEWIKERREAAGLTQVQLAERLGVKQTTVSNWETGYNGIEHDNLYRLPDALGATDAEFGAALRLPRTVAASKDGPASDDVAA